MNTDRAPEHGGEVTAPVDLALERVKRLTRHATDDSLDWDEIHEVLRQQPVALLELAFFKGTHGFSFGVEVCDVARALGITEYAVRKRLKTLEVELGAPLRHVFDSEAQWD